MIKTIIFIMLVLVLLGCLILTLIQTGCIWFKKIKSREYVNNHKKLLRLFRLMAALLVATLLIVSFSQILAYTPKIQNATDNSISELIKIDINDKKQWISIRGKDLNNPIILFLAGGPGGTQLGAARRNLAALEEEYVIVNWEQPGSGKSYNAVKNISPDTYIEDGVALTNYLLQRFKKDKIYLMGESWGSALGVFLAEKEPEKYYAFIGTGQMVAFEETEKECYQLALKLAEEKNDVDKVEELKKLGQPPYYGKNVALRAAKYLQYLSDEMAHNPNIHNAGYETISDLSSPEYGIIDQINFFRGVVTTFSNVYPQLYEIDLRKDYSVVDIPIYFFIGRYDLNAPTHLTEDYFDLLEAPDKRLVWFENSGHNPWINENDLFCKKTIEMFVQHKNK